MKKIISILLSFSVLFSVCGVCLASSKTPAGISSEVTYGTASERTVERSESVVYEEIAIKSDLQIVSENSGKMSQASAGGVKTTLKRILGGLGAAVGTIGLLILGSFWLT